MLENVERLRSYLFKLEDVAGVPRLDIAWLRLRCDDTLCSSGERQRDSLRQLQKDVRSFVEEFPTILPAELAASMLAAKFPS
jgi:hypothetical protein